MKIQVERDRIVRALRKVEGIELVLENENDAKEAIAIILSKSEVFPEADYQKIKDVSVKEIKEYKTSAVQYTTSYLLEFPFGDEVSLERRSAIIKGVQSLFDNL